MEKTQEMINRAIETYDHVLWECIAKACGFAYSQAFAKKGSRVRVVYRLSPGIDPRQPDTFQLIQDLIQEYIDWGLSIIKTKMPDTTAGSTEYYLEYGKQIATRALVEVVIIGYPTHSSQIICPCQGWHLKNTKELKHFRVELKKPKKIGKDTYEFRFKIY